MPDTIQTQDPFALAHQRLLEMAKTDPELAALIPLASVYDAMQDPACTATGVIDILAEHYGTRRALASRAYEIAPDPETGQNRRRYQAAYTAITYTEMWNRMLALATAWRHHPEHKLAAGEFICNFGYTGTDMTILECASLYAQTVSVPLQANLQPADIALVFEDTSPSALAASFENLERVVALAAGSKTVRSVVVFDIDIRDDTERAQLEAGRATLKEHNIAVTTIDALIAYGSRINWTPLPRHVEGEKRIAALIYTSGSTGSPKGAIINELISKAQWSLWPGAKNLWPCVTFNYQPLNHMGGRAVIFNTLAQGGTVYFTLKSDWSTLFEDIRLVRPTAMQFLPRVAEMIQQHYHSEVLRRISKGEEKAIAELHVQNEMRYSFLGDRLRRGTIGSSATSQELRDFIRDCFDIAFREGYGTTESGGLIANGYKIVRGFVSEYRLLDVPELGYYKTDKPYPRGEFTFKSWTTIPGYYNRPEASAAIFDADGFQLSGDIVEEQGPDHIVWVDRRNNVIKLSQAEFVAIGPLEAVFDAGSELIKQIYVYGNSQRSYLLAVVVPDVALAEAKLGHAPDDAELQHLLRGALQDIGRAAGLKTFEVPRDVIIERETFTYENGLLSSARKPLRPKLKAKYGERLEALYTEITRRQQEDLAALRDGGADISSLDRIVGALKASLGVDEIDLSPPKNFRELGVDSLGAVGLSLLLEEIFETSVPVADILNPAGSPQRLAAQIEARLQEGENAGPTMAKVHGKQPTTLYAKDLTVAAFIDRATLDAVPKAPPAQTHTVLITGASGFLGRFLCLDWLERVAKTGGKVICIIRAANAADARRRLDATFGDRDPQLIAHFRALAVKHLEVLPGDLAEKRLGLSESEFDRLAEAVDQIVHPGALVNHRLSYENLFGPNVAGTAEIIRLALTKKLKRIDNISSVAVANLMHDRLNAKEAVDVRIGAPTVDLSERYAVGYAASKWAGEVLLRDAHEKYGVPVNVFRADMIMPHSRYKGQINVPDMFTRLLFSLVKTGLAPLSFYTLGPDGKRQKAHYDGLPGDFISGAMLGIGDKPYQGYRSYNVINMHDDDGVSLDSVADWVASAGYRLEFIASHADWIERFETRLRALPEEERRHSSLDILGHLANPHDPDAKSVASEDFAAAARILPVGPDVPHLTEAFIHKYLDDMRRLGLIPSAP